MQGEQGWDLKAALNFVRQRDAGTPSGAAAEAVAARIDKVGECICILASLLGLLTASQGLGKPRCCAES